VGDKELRNPVLIYEVLEAVELMCEIVRNSRKHSTGSYVYTV